MNQTPIRVLTVQGVSVNATIRVLLVDCEDEFIRNLALALVEEGIQPQTATGRIELFDQLQTSAGDHELVLIGQLQNLEEQEAIITDIRRQYPHLDIITLTDSQHTYIRPT